MVNKAYYVVSPASALLFLVLWLTKILMIGTLQWRWKKENWCFAQIGNVSALFHMMMHGALFSFPLVVVVLVRSVSVYSPIFSTQFLAPFECLWWFFSKCSSTFLNGSHCNLPTKKKHLQKKWWIFLCLRAFENASFLSDLWASFVQYKLEREKKSIPSFKSREISGGGKPHPSK